MSESAALHDCKNKVYNRLNELVGEIETFKVNKDPFYVDRDQLVSTCLRDVNGIVQCFVQEHRVEMAVKRDAEFVAKHERPSSEVRKAYLARITALARQGSGHKPYVKGFNPTGIHHFNIPSSKYEESLPNEVEVEAFQVTGDRCLIHSVHLIAGWH